MARDGENLKDTAWAVVAETELRAKYRERGEELRIANLRLSEAGVKIAQLREELRGLGERINQLEAELYNGVEN